MAIHNELSNEIAVALLTGKERNAGELNDLKKVILTIHDTLQELTVNSPRRSVGEQQERNDKKRAAEAGTD